MSWQVGDKFVEPNGVLVWSVQDFDLETETVLGYCEDGSSRIFYFGQILRMAI